MSKTSSGLFNTSPLSLAEKRSFIEELRNRGEKFNEKNMEFITKDATGQIIWLEKGSSTAGLEHITQRHENDFKDALGIDKSQIPNFLENIITHGEIVSNRIVSRKGRQSFERKYKYNNKYYILTGIGSNGFVVSAYPTTK